MGEPRRVRDGFAAERPRPGELRPPQQLRPPQPEARTEAGTEAEAKAGASASPGLRERQGLRGRGLLLVAGLLLWAAAAAVGRAGGGHPSPRPLGSAWSVAGSSSAYRSRARAAEWGAGTAGQGAPDAAVRIAGTSGNPVMGPLADRTGTADARPGSGGVWPVPPPVLRRFAPPPVRWAAGHRGVDLPARPGQEVRTVLSGILTFAGEVAGTPVVVVTHPGTGAPPLRTTYEPVATSLPVGTVVSRGGPIGVLTGSLPAGHCPGCLHWGLLRGDRYLDPLSLLGLGRVRLLPLSG